LWRAPCEESGQAPLGSTLRFSQPLSGFLASLKVRGPISCRSHSWDPALQSLPLAVSAHPSRGRLLPCSYPLTCKNELPETLSPPVSPTPTLSRGCLVPPATMSALSTNQSACFLVALGLTQRSRSVPPASPASKLCSPCESVRTGPSCPEPAVDALLGFCPSRAFSVLASDPVTRPSPKARTLTLVRRLRRATRRTSQPLEPGEAFPTPKCRELLVGSTRSPSRPDRTASRRRPYSLDLDPTEQARCSLILGALKYEESGFSPKRSPALLGFLSSSTTSRLWNLRRPWLIVSPKNLESVSEPRRSSSDP
jgi:hypothetical protein